MTIWQFDYFCHEIAHFFRKYDICKCLLKILAMIEHGQVQIGSAVSGQSKKLNGFHVLSLGIGGV